MTLSNAQLQHRLEQSEKKVSDTKTATDTKVVTLNTSVTAINTQLTNGTFTGVIIKCAQVQTSNSRSDGVNSQNTFTGTTGTRVATGSGVTYTSATASNINTISASFDALAIKYNSLVAKHNNLLAVLQDAGIIGTIGGGTGLVDLDEARAVEAFGLSDFQRLRRHGILLAGK